MFKFRAFCIVALLLSGLALFAMIWTVVQPPTYALWVFAVGTTEWSLYFGILGLSGAAMGWSAQRRGARGAGLTAAIIGIAALALSFLPFAQTFPVARANHVSLSLLEYFGMGSARVDRSAIATETQTYADANGHRLLLDAYLGAHSAAMRPAIVVVHGGSWNQGNRSDFAPWDYYLAGQGYAIFDIDYSLQPQPNWQSALQDVQTAVRWVRQNAQHFAVDPNRIVLLGRSAGGQLALDAAYTAPPDARVAGVVSVYGPTDLAWGYEHVAYPDVIHARQKLSLFLGGSPTDVPDAYRSASPIDRVDAETPPTLMFHGGRDRIVGPQHMFRLDAVLRAAKVPSEAIAIPYALHGFDYNFDGWGSQIIRPILLKFLHSLPAHPRSATSEKVPI